ncbi:hypothetical protein FB451DRAFT_1409264 [Mycena latifolia]|nr:hypothetical protein FB451DRAFT_1409264 [Mycena latifolia]
MQAQRRPRRLLALQGFRPSKRRKSFPAATLTLDAVRTTLEVMESAADACPPLKSTVGAVVALCKIRLAASNTDAGTLAWRAITILDTIYNSMDAKSPDAIPLHLVHHIVQFEHLLTEIRTAMESIQSQGRLRRLLHLRRNESQLATFTERLNSAAQVFTIGAMSSQTVSLAHIEAVVEKVSSGLEQSNAHLRGQVRFLQITVVFLA